MKFKKTTFILSVLVLSGCSLLTPKSEFIPDSINLKEAAVGVPYMAKIDILGGVVIGGEGLERKIGFIIPNDTGLYLRNCQSFYSENATIEPHISDNYNCVEIYGTPTKRGIIKVNIGGRMYGSMVSKSTSFSKTYNLRVKPEN
ncbi:MULTISPECIES: hypothetical protein [Enterobacterales]|uniref:Lipoprotein n=1 Tax=Serratia marcescens TaxID=615 RepID=A0A5C7BF27_SERMA|nr:MULTISPECIES: hypothetical protein [Enterobacterales]TXE21696.1 hypothetical protein FOT62_27655 [Serratia marcescens]TXE57171.1 hypothetical protein FOT56_23455 [Serratia marcescens]